MPSRFEIEEANRKAGRKLLAEGEQAGLFGAEGAPIAPEKRGPGRPAGAGNKLKSKLRDYMAARGYRDPAEQLAMIAGLDQRELHPMAYAAQVAASIGEPVLAVVGQMRQAAADLLPYWHAKLTPDVAVQGAQVNILMQGSDGSVALRIEGGDDPFAPLDVRAGVNGESVEYQGLGDAVLQGSDGKARTE